MNIVVLCGGLSTERNISLISGTKICTALRRKGIAARMVSILIEEAWSRGVTEISLDATEAGRPLYRKLGFHDSGEYMVLEKENT